MTDELSSLRLTTSVALLADYAMGRGLPLSSILRGTGIGESQLNDPTGEIMLRQELDMISNIVAAIDDEPGQGLRAGLLCHPPSFGVLGFAMMSSPNLRHALEIGIRYAELSFTAAQLHLHDEGAEVWVVRDDKAIPESIRRFALERDLAAIATIGQDLLSTRVPVTRVQIPLAPNPIYETFAAVLGVEEIVFEAPGTTLIIQSSALQLPLPQANTTTRRFYEQQCAEVIERRRSRMGVSKQVRQVLLHHGGVADQARVAADLNISIRTLRRRLAEERTTFRELSHETLGLLAEELLTAGLTVENVADRLGYASTSAFATAFRTWRGLSPGNFARAKRGLASVGA